METILYKGRGPAHAKRFAFGVIRVNTSDRGWTDECVGEPMPSVKKATDSAASLLLQLLNRNLFLTLVAFGHLVVWCVVYFIKLKTK